MDVGRPVTLLEREDHRLGDDGAGVLDAPLDVDEGGQRRGLDLPDHLAPDLGRRLVGPRSLAGVTRQDIWARRRGSSGGDRVLR